MGSAQTTGAPRVTLTRARVLDTAVALADRDGIGSLSMRNLARELGIEAMSLYHHVANKKDLLDGVADVVGAEIQDAVSRLDPLADDAERSAWKAAVRRQILTARVVLLRHPWAPGVLGSRTAFTPHLLRYYDSIVALLRRGGFSYDLAYKALAALGSRALGFTQALFESDGGSGSAHSGDDDGAALLIGTMSGQVPHMAGLLAHVGPEHDPGPTLGWCDDQARFEFGLDLVLDGLDRLAARGTY